MPNDFEGLVCLVTGGSSGIGERTALLLQERGATVFVLDRNEPASRHNDVHFIACDLADPAAVQDAVKDAAAFGGSLDVVINNAGIGAQGDAAANSDEEWADVLSVNVTSIARVARTAVPHLARSAHAAIVNVSSAVAITGVPNRALYAASKGAVHALTLAMAADYIDAIRVNCVMPATADTPWIARLLESAEDPERALADLTARQPMGRLVSPDHVAWSIANLASPLSATSTGQSVVIDGGMTSLRLPPRATA